MYIEPTYYFDINDIKNADIIHWNNGLWDVLHFGGNSNPYTPLDIYVKTVTAVYDKLRELNKNCKVVFATTTVIPEELQKTTSYRRNSEIDKYNQVVTQVLSSKGVVIEDLYSNFLSLDVSYRGKDGLHYTELGSEKIAKFVIEAITKLFAV